MKFNKLAGFGVAALAAASIAMVSTNAVAKTQPKKTTTAAVKCYGTNPSGNSYAVSVSKSICDQIGGSTTKPNANNNMNMSNPNTPSMTNPGATPPANTGNPGGGVTPSNPNQ